MIFSAVYLLVCRLLSCLMVLARREASKDAELLVLRHENAVLRRQIGRVRCQPGDRLWLARLIPRHRWGEVFVVAPATGAPFGRVELSKELLGGVQARGHPFDLLLMDGLEWETESPARAPCHPLVPPPPRRCHPAR